MHPFSYDPFQQKAISLVRQGISLFISAPTGSGKTVIAEVAVEEALKNNGMAVYTAPIKALSNQKFRDFHALYPDKVGILTGDVTLNPDAPLLIMTTEIYRNSLLEGGSRFANCRWVIFDEVHYLDDSERGTVWEESLLLTPRETEILALSATIPNAREMASWIEKIHGRPVEVIEETHRPIPLKIAFQCQNQLFESTEKLQAQGYAGRERLRSPRAAARNFPRRHFHRSGKIRHAAPPAPAAPANRVDHLVRAIEKAGRLPFIYFTFSRKRAETLAWEFAALGMASEATQNKLLSEYDQLCKRFELESERSAREMRKLIGLGVAYHHAGLLPTLKEVIEILFTKRLIPAIATTETFALGVNMPARSVVLDTLTKRADHGRRILRRRELSQMVGRAGRRGMDEAGFVYLRVNPWEIDYPSMIGLLQGEPEKVSSRFSTTYATLLNLYRTHGENLLPFYLRTFHAFQKPPSQHREVFALVERKVRLLQQLGYVESTTPEARKLTHKGEFAGTLYGYELLLSELFEVGFLDTLSPTDLGILLLAMVYEPRRGTPPPSAPPRRLKRLIETTLDMLDKIHLQEKRHRIFPLSKRPSFDWSGPFEQWISGQLFDHVVDAAKADEGEMVRYFRMTIQLARSLHAAPAAPETLRRNAKKLIEKINRDPVDAEAELRRSL